MEGTSLQQTRRSIGRHAAAWGTLLWAACSGALTSGGAGAQQHYSTLLRLKQYFPFSLIDAMGSLDECKAQIARELRYQSSLDLDESTCAACCLTVPCAHA